MWSLVLVCLVPGSFRAYIEASVQKGMTDHFLKFIAKAVEEPTVPVCIPADRTSGKAKSPNRQKQNHGMYKLVWLVSAAGC